MTDVIELQEAAETLVRSRVVAYWDLTKPRVSGMVLIVTALGFYLALPSGIGPSSWVLLAHTLLGTALIAAGANALNQFREADHDRRMTRTEDRPIPSGRLTGSEVLCFAVVFSAAGAAYLALYVNLLASLLAVLAWVIYGFVYTPLKRTTSLCVYVGAVSGALPPVIGWAAATGSIAVGAAFLFAILFFWQLPHFAAIAWLYREDYGRAGYPLLPVVDRDGSRTSLHMLTHTVALLVVSLLPVIYGLAGVVYAIGAMVLGLAFLTCGVWFALHKSKAVARFTLLSSVVYLPCLLALMVIDKSPVS